MRNLIANLTRIFFSRHQSTFKVGPLAAFQRFGQPKVAQLTCRLVSFNSIRQQSILLPSVGIVGAFTVIMAAQPPASNTLSVEEQTLVKQADELYDANKLTELEQLLNKPELLEKSPGRAEFEWRLARCWYQQIKEKQRDGKEVVKAKDLVLSALEHNPECGPAHKWASILVDSAAAAIGTKERIKQLLTVKDHMQKAIQYNPTDPTSYYLLGEWHFSCYNVSWAERQIAKVIFGTLPEPDLEEALSMFKKAEEIEPGFYSRNLLLMAKTLNALKKEPEVAKQSLRIMIEKYGDSQKWDDLEAVKEAKDLLRKMGDKV